MAIESPMSANNNEHNHHVRYWSGVKAKSEEDAKIVLEEGNNPMSLATILGRHNIEIPEDWDDIMSYCTKHGAVCRDVNRLYRASVSWLQAYNELEYKRNFS